MNPPSIAEQIETLERQIRDLRDSHSANGQITDSRAARDVECLEATVALLKSRL